MVKSVWPFPAGSIFSQILFRFIIVIVLLALIIGLTTLTIADNSMQRLFISANTKTLQQINQNFINYNNQIIYMINQFSLNKDLRKYLVSPINDQFYKYRMLNEVGEYLSTFTSLFDSFKLSVVMIGVNGQIYTSNSQTFSADREKLYKEDFVLRALEERQMLYL